MTLTYAEFGASFVQAAVTPERICAVIQAIAGETVEVGPLRAGPGGMAVASATGTVTKPDVELVGDHPLTYAVRVPVDLVVDVELAGGSHRFTAEGEVRLALTARLQAPLSICVDPVPPTPEDVTVSVQAKGLQARMIGRVGDIDGELRREVAAYVAERIATDAAEYAEIDVRELIDKAWPID